MNKEIFYNEKGEIVDYSIYESNEIKIVKQFIKKKDCVLELGARYGGVSCAINNILTEDYKEKQYSVEPDERVWEALEKNKNNHNCKFNIIKGTISKDKMKIIKNSRKFNDNNDWATYTEIDKSSNIQNYDLPSCRFNVLVADCEGFLETFYNENKELFDELRLIIVEKDRPEYCNYEYLENEFLSMGFQKVYSLRDFQVVYQRVITKRLPKIFYINLDERKDRRDHMEKILEGYDYERIPAIKHEDGYIGCALSHKFCVQLAIGYKYDSVIILEDDFMFYNDNNFDNIKLPQQAEDYDIFLLCNRIKEHDKIDNNFVKVKECSWTSGHILKKTIYNDLIDNLEQGIKDRELNGKKHKNNLDVYWNKLWEKYKCITHNYLFATQKDGYSDIINEKINRRLDQSYESKFS